MHFPTVLPLGSPGYVTVSLPLRGAEACPRFSRILTSQRVPPSAHMCSRTFSANAQTQTHKVSPFKSALYDTKRRGQGNVCSATSQTRTYELLEEAGMQVHLVGTNHKSSRDVKRASEMVTTIRPELVFIEQDMERAAGLVNRLKSRELRKTGGTLAELFVEEATGTVLWDTSDQGPAPRGWGSERSLGVKLLHGKLIEVVGCGSTDRGAQPYPKDRSVAEYKAIQNGARWRMELETGEEFVAAFEAACTVGATAIVLGDQPASMTKRRLQELSAERIGRAAPTAANSLSTMIRNSCATLVLLLLPSALSPDGGQGIVTAMGQRLLRDLGFLVMVGSVILSLPGINTSIFQEIKQGPELNEEDIEQALLHERDVYMARTLRTVLGLQEGQGKTPMFMLSHMGDLEYWRLEPDGIYNAKEGTEVVAVVGSAHLPGFCRAWRKAQWKKATSSVA